MNSTRIIQDDISVGMALPPHSGRDDEAPIPEEDIGSVEVPPTLCHLMRNP